MFDAAECLHLPRARQQPTAPGSKSGPFRPTVHVWVVCFTCWCTHANYSQTKLPAICRIVFLLEKKQKTKAVSLCFCRQVNVTLPEETRNNGTLHAVIYVHKSGVSPLEDSREVHSATQLTTYTTPTRDGGQRDVQKVKHRACIMLDLAVALLQIQTCCGSTRGRAPDQTALCPIGDLACQSPWCQRTSPSTRRGSRMTCGASWECKSVKSVLFCSFWVQFIWNWNIKHINGTS